MKYIHPTGKPTLPLNLTLTQFVQSVIVGLSEIEGTLVRPDWQESPPTNPDIKVNWIAFGVKSSTPDANAYVGATGAGQVYTQRHEELEVPLSLYGPDAFDTAALIRDGFQIQTNLDALRSAKMGFKETSQAIRMPDLVNERFINRVTMSVFLRREIIRNYPVPTLLSANGTIHTVIGDEEYVQNFQAGPLEEP